MRRGIESTPIINAAPRRAARRLYYSHDSRCPYHRCSDIRHQPSPLGLSLRLRPRYISVALSLFLSLSLPLSRNSFRLPPTWPTRSLLHPSPCFFVRSSRHPRLALIHSDGSPVNSHRLGHPRCRNSASFSISVPRAASFSFPPLSFRSFLSVPLPLVPSLFRRLLRLLYVHNIHEPRSRS